MKLLKNYGELSNLQMNTSKSEILNLNMSKQVEQNLQKEIPLSKCD